MSGSASLVCDVITTTIESTSISTPENHDEDDANRSETNQTLSSWSVTIRRATTKTTITATTRNNNPENFVNVFIIVIILNYTKNTWVYLIWSQFAFRYRNRNWKNEEKIEENRIRSIDCCARKVIVRMLGVYLHSIGWCVCVDAKARTKIVISCKINWILAWSMLDFCFPSISLFSGFIFLFLLLFLPVSLFGESKSKIYTISRFDYSLLYIHPSAALRIHWLFCIYLGILSSIFSFSVSFDSCLVDETKNKSDSRLCPDSFHWRVAIRCASVLVEFPKMMIGSNYSFYYYLL